LWDEVDVVDEILDLEEMEVMGFEVVAPFLCHQCGG
jgi:hypothetical protein